MNQTFTPKQLRDFALDLLDDSHGISANAFDRLNPLLEDSGNQDVVNSVVVTKDRAFLEEDAAAILRLTSPANHLPAPTSAS